MTKTAFLFDLDGTLFDPIEGLGKSVNSALVTMGKKTMSMEEIGSFIGPPLIYSFVEYCGFSEEEALKAIELYREYYGSKGIYEASFYPGMRSLIGKLQEGGADIYLATSKPLVYAERIIKHHKLDEIFSFLSAPGKDDREISKKYIVKAAIDYKNRPLDEYIMVGDRKYDIEGAKVNGIESVGILHGYGSREELEEAGADYIVKDSGELEKLLLSFRAGDKN